MKYKSAMVTQASGSVGGMTASHNRGGMYMRARTIPVNPNTVRQQMVRNYFTALVQAWTNTLTADQRGNWSEWAANVPFTTTLGDQLILSGQQAYIRANTPRLQNNLARIDAAPTIFDNGEPVTDIQDAGSATPGTIGMTAAPDTLATNVIQAVAPSDDGDLLWSWGRAINPSVNFYKGPYQAGYTGATAPVAVASGVGTTAVGTAAADLTIDAPPVIGQRRAVSLRIAYDDGRLSLPFRVIALILDAAA